MIILKIIGSTPPEDPYGITPFDAPIIIVIASLMILYYLVRRKKNRIRTVEEESLIRKEKPEEKVDLDVLMQPKKNVKVPSPAQKHTPDETLPDLPCPPLA